MSYVRFETRHLGDARWLDATPAAFTLHAWALDYCNEQATDGVIPTKVAHRLQCPVEPADIPATFDVLIDLGFWERTDHGYVCPEFLAHGLPADEQNATRAKWAQDKRRRTLCSLGNHQLCTPRSKCPVPPEQRGTPPATTPPRSGTDSTNPPVEKWTTRPDQTPKGMVGSRGSGRTAAGGSAGAPPTTTALPPIRVTGASPLDEDDTSTNTAHVEITVGINSDPDADPHEHHDHWPLIRTILEQVASDIADPFADTKERCDCWDGALSGNYCARPVLLPDLDDTPEPDDPPELFVSIPASDYARWERTIASAIRNATALATTWAKTGGGAA